MEERLGFVGVVAGAVPNVAGASISTTKPVWKVAQKQGRCQLTALKMAEEAAAAEPTAAATPSEEPAVTAAEPAVTAAEPAAAATPSEEPAAAAAEPAAAATPSEEPAAAAAAASSEDPIEAQEAEGDKPSGDKGQKGRGGRKQRRDVKYQMEDLQVGMELEGTVRSTTNYGAFVDVGCATDGLVHVSQLSTEFVEKVEDVVKTGDSVKVRIISTNPEKKEFSLSMKPEGAADSKGQGRGQSQDAKNAWKNFTFDPKSFVTGKVVSVTDYGAFVDVDGPTDGMVHISEMAESRVESVDAILAVGDEIEVRITDVDSGRRRISLSMVEWKEPGEEEKKVSESKQALMDANQASESSVEFRSAFEIALEQAAAKAEAQL